MLFKYLEETIMPNLNHCIDCDKPMHPPNSKGLCDNCYHKVTRELGGDTGINADWEKEMLRTDSMPDIKCDGEPTTADEYNKEWLNEQKENRSKAKAQ